MKKTAITPYIGLPLSRSTAGGFGPLFRALDDSNVPILRSVVGLELTDEENCNWRLLPKAEQELILRDGGEHWMEQTLGTRRKRPGCSFALRCEGCMSEHDWPRWMDTLIAAYERMLYAVIQMMTHDHGCTETRSCIDPLTPGKEPIA